MRPNALPLLVLGLHRLHPMVRLCPMYGVLSVPRVCNLRTVPFAAAGELNPAAAAAAER